MFSAEIDEALRQKRWVFDSIFPSLEETFRLNLANKYPLTKFNENISISRLSAGYYLDKKYLSGSDSDGKKAPGSEVDIIDAESTPNTEFWKTALSMAVSADAKLASLDLEDIALIGSAIQSVRDNFSRDCDPFDYVKKIIFFDEPESEGASQPFYMGSIFINANLIRSEALEENLVHEIAHQELFCLNFMDRLIQEESDDKLRFAPYQGTERPPIGRLHAAHAIYRIAQYYDSIQSEKLSRNLKYLSETLETFEKGDLTLNGRFLIEECYQPLLTRRRKIA